MASFSLQELAAMARQDAIARGFRHTGIYNLLWVVWKNLPEEFTGLLKSYRVEQALLVKMLETILRPRRAGGGVPRDRRDAELLELALAAADRQARSREQEPGVEHLFMALPELDEDPLVALCERFGLDYQRPGSDADEQPS